jgi:CRP-like cAMP-binding protein
MVELKPGDILQEVGEEIQQVYFPMEGVLSILAVLSTGEAIEAATVGREGMAGLPVFLGSREATTRTEVQVGGTALVLETATFRAALHGDSGKLAVAMARYAEIMFMSAAQGVACNRMHSLSARLARAILTWHDRMAHEVLPVTQDALADALGVRRAGVTAAISEFVRAGALRRGRGRLYLTHRQVLEQHACECYAVLAEAYRRPIG